MWSERGSGFEANQYSPAGTSQREWLLLQRLGRTRYGRYVTLALLGLLVLVVVLSAVQSAMH